MALFKKPQYSQIPRANKKDIPPGLWKKCTGCAAVVYRSKLEKNLNVCPDCGWHHPLTVVERIRLLTEPDSFTETEAGLRSVDVLEFDGGKLYPRKLEESRAKTGLAEAIVTGTGRIRGIETALGVMDFRFLGASMGAVVGEKVTRLTELATDKRLPLVLVTASGGARMYEGMYSLMQMAKTAGALAILQSAGLPYIVVMTHPTTAGVTASFASLGDIILAEPKALIAFAGPRVIQQTTKSQLPPGFQTAEFLLQHGLIDRVVQRHLLTAELGTLLACFSGALHCEKNGRTI